MIGKHFNVSTGEYCGQHVTQELHWNRYKHERKHEFVHTLTHVLPTVRSVLKTFQFDVLHVTILTTLGDETKCTERQYLTVKRPALRSMLETAKIYLGHKCNRPWVKAGDQYVLRLK